MAAVEQFANNASTVILGAITAIQTSFNVSSNTGFPAVTTASTNFFYITIEQEICKVTDNSSTLWLVTRGHQGTIASSHASGVTLYQTVTKQTMTDITAAVASAGGSLYGTYAALPAAGTSGRLYFTSDSVYTFRDNGVTWDAFYKGRKVKLPPAAATLSTIRNPSTSSIVDSFGTLYFQAPGVGGDNVRVYTKSYTGPKTLEVGFTPSVGGINYHKVGLIMANSGNVLLQTYGLHSINSQNSLNMQNYNSPTSISSQLALDFSELPKQDYILRLQDDGTNKLVSHSVDLGLTFCPTFSTPLTGWVTPNLWGLYIDTGSTVRSNVSVTIWHWNEY